MAALARPRGHPGPRRPRRCPWRRGRRSRLLPLRRLLARTRRRPLGGAGRCPRRRLRPAARRPRLGRRTHDGHAGRLRSRAAGGPARPAHRPPRRRPVGPSRRGLRPGLTARSAAPRRPPDGMGAAPGRRRGRGRPRTRPAPRAVDAGPHRGGHRGRPSRGRRRRRLPRARPGPRRRVAGGHRPRGRPGGGARTRGRHDLDDLPDPLRVPAAGRTLRLSGGHPRPRVAAHGAGGGRRPRRPLRGAHPRRRPHLRRTARPGPPVGPGRRARDQPARR